jgi:hypothetical protein
MVKRKRRKSFRKDTSRKVYTKEFGRKHRSGKYAKKN